MFISGGSSSLVMVTTWEKAALSLVTSERLVFRIVTVKSSRASSYTSPMIVTGITPSVSPAAIVIGSSVDTE